MAEGRLAPCPCGKIPDKLHITDNDMKWAYVTGSCCDEWSLEFRTDYALVDSQRCMDLAIERWNSAQRTHCA